MTRAARLMSGLILILVPTVQYGGVFLLKSLLNNAATHYMDLPLRQNLERAGHAHAGVIILLSLIGQLLADHAVLPAQVVWAIRIALPVSAMLLSAGFFLSVAGDHATRAGPLIGLVWIGAAVLAISVLTLAVGLLRPRRAPM